MRSKMKISSLNLIELFNSQEYKGFLDNFHKRSFSKNSIISMPAQPSNDVLIVSSGRLRVYLSYEGREFTLCYLEEGDIFSTHSRAFISAAKDSIVLLTSAKIFQKQVVIHPEISLAMTGILGEVLGSSWDVIEGLIFRDVKSRLIAFIVSLARERGKEVGKSIEFECDLTMEDIALIIGTTRQTTSSLFNVMLKDGDITRITKNRYVINDMPQLEAQLSE